MFCLQWWYVGDTPDVNLGYAYNTDTTATCAEDMATGTWFWWDYENGVWTLDDTARMICI